MLRVLLEFEFASEPPKTSLSELFLCVAAAFTSPPFYHYFVSGSRNISNRWGSFGRRTARADGGTHLLSSLGPRYGSWPQRLRGCARLLGPETWHPQKVESSAILD